MGGIIVDGSSNDSQTVGIALEIPAEDVLSKSGDVLLIVVGVSSPERPSR
jgi:hypothetical protein